MKNLKRSEKILLSILALAIVFYVYYTFLLNPVLNRISASHDNIESYNEQINNIKIKESQLTKLKADYETYKNDYEELCEKFPSFEKDPQIGYDLKILADKSNISIQNQIYSAANIVTDSNNPTTSGSTAETSSASATNKEDRFKLNYVAVNMSITGSYEKIKSFINSLENGTRSAIITNVNITKADNVITASIIANFYFITDSQNTDENSYDFNNKSYGKSNFFN